MLEEAKSSRGGSSQHNGGGGALSLHNINAEANRVAEEFENYKIHSNMEVKKLKDIKKDIKKDIDRVLKKDLDEDMDQDMDEEIDDMMKKMPIQALRRRCPCKPNYRHSQQRI